MRPSRLKQLRALNGFGTRCFLNVHVILEYLQEYFTLFKSFFPCCSGKFTVICRHQVSTVGHGEHSFHLKRGLIVEKLKLALSK